MTIDEYLLQIGKGLRRFGFLARRPLDEIREHLIDTAQALQEEEGMTPADAQEHAVRRFGAAPEVVQRFTTVLEHEPNPMERITRIISITTLFTAIWGLAASLMLNPRIDLVVVTALVTLATAAGAFAVARKSVEASTVVISGVVLLAVGAAGVLWALIGARASEPQIGLALLMTLYVGQGVLTVILGIRRGGPTQPAVVEPTAEAAAG